MQRIFYLATAMILMAVLTFCSTKQEQTKQTKAVSEMDCSSYSPDNPACAGCSGEEAKADESVNVSESQRNQQGVITFIELGSVNCIPCKKMQPVMKSIETKYGKQIKVVFHDVWTDEGKPFASQYGIRLIPTQIFEDANGAEIMRHEGFFAENEIDNFLQSHGLTIQ